MLKITFPVLLAKLILSKYITLLSIEKMNDLVFNIKAGSTLLMSRVFLLFKTYSRIE